MRLCESSGSKKKAQHPDRPDITPREATILFRTTVVEVLLLYAAFLEAVAIVVKTLPESRKGATTRSVCISSARLAYTSSHQAAKRGVAVRF